MQRNLLTHFVCPDTLRPLGLNVELEDGDAVIEGELSSDAKSTYPIHRGIPTFVREDALRTQTARSFSQKWAKHQYYREHTREFYTDWYLQRYGFHEAESLREFLADARFILDAGTGSGRDALNFAENSTAAVFAVDLAAEALEAASRQVTHPRIAFVHADLNRLPFPDEYFDFLNCDQVIHHMPNPRATFDNLRRKLKTNGTICCYVYRKKAVLREFTDDHVREHISGLSVDEALEVCEGITRLGEALANLKTTVDIPEDIPVLGIKKGKIDLQRFVHWNIMKCFWNDKFDFFTNNIVNLDWYHPENCFRFEPDDFREWFAEGWEILAWDVREAGISCRARKV